MWDQTRRAAPVEQHHAGERTEAIVETSHPGGAPTCTPRASPAPRVHELDRPVPEHLISDADVAVAGVSRPRLHSPILRERHGERIRLLASRRSRWRAHPRRPGRVAGPAYEGIQRARIPPTPPAERRGGIRPARRPGDGRVVDLHFESPECSVRILPEVRRHRRIQLVHVVRLIAVESPGVQSARHVEERWLPQLLNRATGLVAARRVEESVHRPPGRLGRALHRGEVGVRAHVVGGQGRGSGSSSWRRVCCPTSPCVDQKRLMVDRGAVRPEPDRGIDKGVPAVCVPQDPPPPGRC